MSPDAEVSALVALVIFTLGSIGAGLVYMMRMAMRWARVEHGLEDLVTDVKQLVADKDRVHAEIVTTMREDRAATDRRLRWLEEHLWKRNGGNGVQR